MRLAFSNVGLGAVMIVLGFSLNCGGGKKASSVPSDVADNQAQTSAIDWGGMNQRERIDHMKKVVMPKMKAVFQAADAERYAEFSCATCHGPGAKRGEFGMPTGALSKLPPHGQFDELKAEQPEVVGFMMKQVVPEMAATIGKAPFDPATGEGFGCYDCHQAD